MQFKITLINLLFTISAFSQTTTIKLSLSQLNQIERGYGMFIHFGINTFNETEWSKGNLQASSYNPSDLDCDQWIKVAKEAGFRYVILVTKHHDGFCLWDSKYTDYDVASSPVKTDVVERVAKACKKYGIKLGLYYSLWDRHELSYKNELAYIDYMKKQLAELMLNYGTIYELWFDGGWDKTEKAWHLQEIYDAVKKQQPNCLITVNHSIGYVKAGAKSIKIDPKNYQYGDPIRYFPIDFRIKDPDLARWDDPKYYKFNDTLYYMSFEHTICLSDRWNWFQKKKILAARPVEELEELFYWCTANNNTLIINVPPDTIGKIRTHEKNRIFELADRLGIRGGKSKLPAGPINISFNQKIKASSELKEFTANKANDFSLETYWTASDSIADIEMDFETKIQFDRIVIFENPTMKDLGDNFSKIRNFKIKEYELQLYNNEKWEPFYTGDLIGACKIIQLPSEFEAEKIRLKIIQSNGLPSISHISVSKKSSKGIRKIVKP